MKKHTGKAQQMYIIEIFCLSPKRSMATYPVTGHWQHTRCFEGSLIQDLSWHYSKGPKLPIMSRGMLSSGDKFIPGMGWTLYSHFDSLVYEIKTYYKKRLSGSSWPFPPYLWNCQVKTINHQMIKVWVAPLTIIHCKPLGDFLILVPIALGSMGGEVCFLERGLSKNLIKAKTTEVAWLFGCY